MNFGEEGKEYNLERDRYKLGERLFLNVLGKENNIKNVLDVGCGNGEFGDILAHYGFLVTYVDGADCCVSYLRNKGKECYQLDLEKENLPFENGSFDVIVSLDVIEHLWNIKHYLNEIRRVLRYGGVLIITTQNYNCWRFRMMSLIGRWEKVAYQSRHKKFYTVKSFKDELERYFNVIGMSGLLYIPFVANRFSLSFGLNFLACDVGIICRKNAKSLNRKEEYIEDVKELISNRKGN